jgi:hypothetical protein
MSGAPLVRLFERCGILDAPAKISELIADMIESAWQHGPSAGDVGGVKALYPWLG